MRERRNPRSAPDNKYPPEAMAMIHGIDLNLLISSIPSPPLGTKTATPTPPSKKSDIPSAPQWVVEQVRKPKK